MDPTIERAASRQGLNASDDEEMIHSSTSHNVPHWFNNKIIHGEQEGRSEIIADNDAHFCPRPVRGRPNMIRRPEETSLLVWNIK